MPVSKHVVTTTGIVLACVLFAGIAAVTLAARAGSAESDPLLREARARARVEAELASLRALEPDLVAARARIDELQGVLARKDVELTELSGRKQERTPRTVTVLGRGRASGVPDVLRFTIGVGVTRPTIREAVAAANEVMERVVTALRREGIEDKDLRTQWVGVGQHWAPDGRVDGYIVRNAVAAKVRDIQRAGRVIQAGVDAGGNDVEADGVSFNLLDDDAALSKARDEAVANAKARADQYARLIGRRLGEVLVVSEDLSGGYGSWTTQSSAATSGSRGSSVPVLPGTEEVSVTVLVVFALS